MPDIEKAGKVGAFSVHPWFTAEILEDIEFPQTRDSLLKYARAQSADQTLLSRIEDLPDVTFHKMEDIANALEVGTAPNGTMHL